MKLEVIFQEISCIQKLLAFENLAQDAIIKAFSLQPEQIALRDDWCCSQEEATTVGLASRKDPLLHGNNNNHGIP